MTTLRDIVQRGLRESGIIAVGTQPDADEFDEAFAHLQTMIKTLFGNELGEPLTTYDFGTSGVTQTFGLNEQVSVQIPKNTRLVCNLSAPSTLYLDPSPSDGARMAVIDSLGNFATRNLTIVGNGRRIENATQVVMNVNSDNREWFYRDDLANWVKVTDLLAGDQSPLPAEFDDLLITMLAIRVNPRFGAETHQETTDILRRIRSQFRARYHQKTEADSELALLLIPSRQQYFGISDFNRGT